MIMVINGACTVNLKILCHLNFKSFFISSGSFHTAMKSPLPVWKQTAKKSFNQINDDDFVKRRGIYDRIIIDCAFREDLKRKESPDPDVGCDGFYPSLTTNGMCYTFNGKKPLDLWKSSEMITTFSNLFPTYSQNNKTFGGSRTVQGNYHYITTLHSYAIKIGPLL